MGERHAPKVRRIAILVLVLLLVLSEAVLVLVIDWRSLFRLPGPAAFAPLCLVQGRTNSGASSTSTVLRTEYEYDWLHAQHRPPAEIRHP